MSPGRAWPVCLRFRPALVGEGQVNLAYGVARSELTVGRNRWACAADGSCRRRDGACRAALDHCGHDPSGPPFDRANTTGGPIRMHTRVGHPLPITGASRSRRTAQGRRSPAGVGAVSAGCAIVDSERRLSVTALLGPRRGCWHRPVTVPPNLDALRGALIGAVRLPLRIYPCGIGPTAARLKTASSIHRLRPTPSLARPTYAPIGCAPCGWGQHREVG